MKSKAAVTIAAVVGILLAACGSPSQVSAPVATPAQVQVAANLSASAASAQGGGALPLEIACQKSQPGKGPAITLEGEGKGLTVYLGDILPPYAAVVSGGDLLATPDSVDCRFAVSYTLPDGTRMALAGVNHSAYFPAAFVGVNADPGSPHFGARVWAVPHAGHPVNAVQVPGTNMLVVAALNNGGFLAKAPAGAPYVPELGVIPDQGAATAGFRGRAVIFGEGQARIDSVSQQGVVTYTLTTPQDKAGTSHTTTIQALMQGQVNVPLLP
ncbi:hypothetical protein HYU17_01000 [Candidatus Woesearchaeota archaeon]|nr:hypothetical protein [Candidatus Woesearchaeota archaeon]